MLTIFGSAASDEGIYATPTKESKENANRINTIFSVFTAYKINKTISPLKNSDIEINAIGIGHDVTNYYEKAIKIADVQELGDAMVDQLVDLFINSPAKRRTLN